MTVSGEYSVRNFTVPDIQSYKGKRQLTKTIPFSEEEAEAAETAGIETLNIRHNPERPEISKALRAAAPNTFMSFALPMQSAKSEYDAFKNYIKDVMDNQFPDKDVTVSANDDVVNALEKYIKK